MIDEFLVISWDGMTVYGGMTAWLPGTGGASASALASHQITGIFEVHGLLGIFGDNTLVGIFTEGAAS